MAAQDDGRGPASPTLVALLQCISAAACLHDPRQRLLAALTGMREFVDGDVITGARLLVEPDGRVVIDEMLTAGRWTGPMHDKKYDYLAGEHCIDPFLLRLGEQANAMPPERRTAAFTRQQLVSDDEWYGCEYFETIRRPINLDHCLYGTMRGPTVNVWYGSGIHRYLNRPPFEPEQAALFRAFLEGIAPLFETLGDNTCDSVPLLVRLTPRQRQLVFATLEGLSAKQIAQRLHLTEQTVQTYFKRLYNDLGIAGRGELIALCLRHGMLVPEQYWTT